MPETFVVTAYFDLICPWCLIGKRHLATALEQFRRQHPDIRIEIDWRSHILLPGTPMSGIPYQEFYERRLGSQAAVTARRAQVQEAAQSAGIQFAFDRIALMPNTLAAHQLIACARQNGSSEQLADLIERLFTAYFMEGRNIGDISVLTAIAGNAGFAEQEIEERLTAPEQRRQFVEELVTGVDEQVSGVPYFVFNKRLAISGAHPPASLLSAMQQALAAETIAAAC